MYVFILFFVLAYAYFAYSIQIIARKTNTENEWFAWIPVLNVYLLCKIADKPGWWVILLVIPLVNTVFCILIWLAIAKARGKPEWLGVLSIIPPVNFVLPGYLAFSD